MFDRLQRRNNSHGLIYYALLSGVSPVKLKYKPRLRRTTVMLTAMDIFEA